MWARLFRNGDYEGSPAQIKTLDAAANVDDFCKAAKNDDAFVVSLSAVDTSKLQVFAPGATLEYIRNALYPLTAPDDFKLKLKKKGPLDAGAFLGTPTTSTSYYTIVAPNTTVVTAAGSCTLCCVVLLA